MNPEEPFLIVLTARPGYRRESIVSSLWLFDNVKIVCYDSLQEAREAAEWLTPQMVILDAVSLEDLSCELCAQYKNQPRCVLMMEPQVGQLTFCQQAKAVLVYPCTAAQFLSQVAELIKSASESTNFRSDRV